MKTDVLYRYEIEYRSEDGPTSIQLREIPVIRETDKCYYVRRFYWGDAERRILKSAHDTYAYNTKEKAKQHFIRRTNTRIRWYEYWMEECNKALELIKEEGGE
jgi:hypothetical protein